MESLPDHPAGPTGETAEDAVDPDVDLEVTAQQELGAPRAVTTVVTIAAGGIVGAEARYGLGAVWPHPPDGWPWSTLVINVSGCLLIGVLMVLITEAFRAHPLLRPFVGVGILGGFTTFSTFAVDIVTLAVHGRAWQALGYLVATPLAALAAVWVGASGTRAVVARGPRPRTAQPRP